MLDESTLIHGNVKNFRRILKEFANQGDIASAIDNRDILKIYYAGDDTMSKGWRTIEPHVLGVIRKKSGNGELAVRAWEQAGASDSYKNIGRYERDAPRKEHEYWTNQKGPFGRTVMPGWRLFKLRGITNVLPADGEHFEVKNKQDHKYDPNDDQLDVIVAARPNSAVGSQKVDGVGDIEQKDTYHQKMSSFDVQSDKWKVDANDQEGNLMANVAAYFSKINKMDKKAPQYYDLINDNGKYTALKRNSAKRKKYSDDQVVGNLADLYNKYSKSDLDKRFFSNRKNDAERADRKFDAEMKRNV